MADASNGGVIYYFCHIHSKMSGKIIIKQAGGAAYINANAEKALYPTIENAAFDTSCGTTGMTPFSTGGESVCTEQFLHGDLASTFEKCLQAVDCKMNKEMLVAGHDDHSSGIVTFMQQVPIIIRSASGSPLTSQRNRPGR